MRCNNCNSLLKKDSSFCPNCGAQIIKPDKTPLILSIVAAIMTTLGFSITINILCILVAIVSIIFTIVKKEKTLRIYSLLLSIYAIIASILWIVFIIS